MLTSFADRRIFWKTAAAHVMDSQNAESLVHKMRTRVAFVNTKRLTDCQHVINWAIENKFVPYTDERLDDKTDAWVFNQVRPEVTYTPRPQFALSFYNEAHRIFLCLGNGDGTFEAGDVQFHYLDSKQDTRVEAMLFQLVQIIQANQRPDKSQESTYLGVITETGGLFDSIEVEIYPPQTPVDLCYEPEVVSGFNNTCRFLEGGSKGLILLHGEPGTGKTSLIRRMIASTSSRECLYMSGSQVKLLNDPRFTNFLLHHNGCILIVEDAEKVLVDRKVDNKSLVDTILNIGDGLLSDLLQINMICTFNIDEKIDPALTRAGRLAEKIRIGRLSKDRAKALALYEGIEPGNITQDITLADLYSLPRVAKKEVAATPAVV